MNRRKFILSASAAGSALILPKSYGQVSYEDPYQAEPLSAERVLQITTLGQNSMSGYVPSGSLYGSSWSQMQSVVSAQLGPESVDAMNYGYLDIGWLADAGSVCAGGYMMSQSRLTAAGALALGRVCMGAAAGWWIGWNVGTLVYNAAGDYILIVVVG